MKKLFFVAILAGWFVAPLLAQAVTVGPVKLEYFVDPGKIIKGEFFLQNEESLAHSFYPSFEKFTENNKGEKIFTKEESDLSTWFKIASPINLNSGEGRTIPFTIVVPKDAPPGGHFAVIWWSTTPPGPAGKQVSIVTRAGILVYLTVSGDIKESGILTNFLADRFFSGPPFNFTVSFLNTGNSYLKPEGRIVIKNLFGKERASAAVNEFGSNILPQSEKSFNVQIQSDSFFFGLYRAEINLLYGTNQQKITQSFWFWVLPWKALVVFIIILFLIFFAIPKGIKKYNTWIISKHGK